MRAIKIGFVTMFAALLLLPPLQMVFPLVKVRPLDEKRVLTPFPDIVQSYLQSDGRISLKIHQWFDDHVGFRSLFIRVKNEIDYFIFNYSSKVFIGYDGWLFGRLFFDNEVALERMGAPGQLRLQGQFTALAAYLKKRHIRLVVLTNPDKETVYPQFVPPDAPILPRNSQFEKLRQFLKQEVGWIYVDGEDTLSNCHPYQTFYRQDVHITFPAGYCIAKDVVAKIAVAEGKPDTFWNPNFTYHRVAGGLGGLVSFMSLLVDPTEVYDIPDEWFHPGDHWSDGTFSNDPQHFFEMIYETKQQLWPEKLPPVVLYGNSFTDFSLAAGMQFQFQRFYRIRSNGVPVKDMLEKIPEGTKYVIVQVLEGLLLREESLPGFMNYDIPSK